MKLPGKWWPVPDRLRRFAFVAWLVGLSACAIPKQPLPSSSIESVLQEHDRKLMAKPGVVGVYVGLMPDGRTKCLKVMLARNDPALIASIPKHLGGYKVETEVTGVLKPY